METLERQGSEAAYVHKEANEAHFAHGVTHRNFAVLIVDDDPGVRMSIQAVLEEERLQSMEAEDGLAALEILRAATTPMVVLTDHNMPRLDGPGLLSYVLTEPKLRQRNAFVYLTAANRMISPTLERQMQELHMRHLRKPFDIDDLLDAIHEAAEHLPEQ